MPLVLAGILVTVIEILAILFVVRARVPKEPATLVTAIMTFALIFWASKQMDPDGIKAFCLGLVTVIAISLPVASAKPKAQQDTSKPK